LDPTNSLQISRFIIVKKGIAVLLVPMLVIVSVYSLYHWMMDVLHPGNPNAVNFKNINNIFFEQFFAILIITDVFLLLFSFFHTDKFHRVIRNSGFIISTILLRISFSVDGIINNLLIITAVLFGLLVIVIHNEYEKQKVNIQ
jgi:NADH:ubiquinone oxidoreductase subunit 4 (subunit M)